MQSICYWLHWNRFVKVLETFTINTLAPLDSAWIMVLWHSGCSACLLTRIVFVKDQLVSFLREGQDADHSPGAIKLINTRRFKIKRLRNFSTILFPRYYSTNYMRSIHDARSGLKIICGMWSSVIKFVIKCYNCFRSDTHISSHRRYIATSDCVQVYNKCKNKFTMNLSVLKTIHASYTWPANLYTQTHHKLNLWQ